MQNGFKFFFFSLLGKGGFSFFPRVGKGAFVFPITKNSIAEGPLKSTGVYPIEKTNKLPAN